MKTKILFVIGVILLLSPFNVYANECTDENGKVHVSLEECKGDRFRYINEEDLIHIDLEFASERKAKDLVGYRWTASSCNYKEPFEPTDSEGNPMENELNTKNPSTEELYSFLDDDATDEDYISGVPLHNNAEDAGINAGVVIYSTENENEICGFTVFDTTDNGITYIDSCESDEPKDSIITINENNEVYFQDIHGEESYYWFNVIGEGTIYW